MEDLNYAIAHATASKQMVSQPCVGKIFGIRGGSDAATVKFYDSIDGNISDEQLKWAIGVVANTSNSICLPNGGIRFKKGVYAVITGTTPDVFVGIPYPKSQDL